MRTTGDTRSRIPSFQETSSVGTCLAAPLAVPSSRTSCSSFLIISVSASTIRPTRAILQSSLRRNVPVIFRSFAKLVLRAQATLVHRRQRAPPYALSNFIILVQQGRGSTVYPVAQPQLASRSPLTRSAALLLR